MGDPWLTIIGMGEDGLSGLSDASRTAIAAADLVFGGPRHLALAGVESRGRAWPVPFSVEPVLACRGRRVVVLASGDPFWFGAGGALTPHLTPDEWISRPAPSSFQLAANALGWRMEEVTSLGLHATDIWQKRDCFQSGARIIATLRDGAAAGELARWLDETGFGATRLCVMERLGGPHQRLRKTTAKDYCLTDVAAPAMLAIDMQGGPRSHPRSPGLPDDSFVSDGQITKSPIRALTIAALQPRRNSLLWDLGAGSGTISVEWCLAGGHAEAVEQRADRAQNIRLNADTFGLGDRMVVHVANSLDWLIGSQVAPDAVFVGGGADDALLSRLWETLPPCTRLVVNAVTLETESLLVHWHAENGGELLRFDIARAGPIGSMRGWMPLRPVTQWIVTR
jgi:precorrin-6Y C5,15-methyltransferase (decarboxylating)